MSYGFGGELQQLVEDELAKGIFANEDELLVVALKAFRQREGEFEQLKAGVRSRIKSLDCGEGVEIEDEYALRAFADEIKAEGRDPDAWRKTVGMFRGDPIVGEMIEEAQRMREEDRRLTRDATEPSGK